MEKNPISNIFKFDRLRFNPFESDSKSVRAVHKLTSFALITSLLNRTRGLRI